MRRAVRSPPSRETTAPISSSVCRLPFISAPAAPSLQSFTAAAAASTGVAASTNSAPSSETPAAAAAFSIAARGPTRIGLKPPARIACSGPSRLSRSQGHATAAVSAGARAALSISRSRWRWLCRMMSGRASGRSVTGSAGRRTSTLPSARRPRAQSTVSAMLAVSSAGREAMLPAITTLSPTAGSMAKRISCASTSLPGPGRRRATKSRIMPCISRASAASGSLPGGASGVPNSAATTSKPRSCSTCSRGRRHARRGVAARQSDQHSHVAHQNRLGSIKLALRRRRAKPTGRRTALRPNA